MEKTMMKNTKKTLWKWVLGLSMLFAGGQSAFAACAGEIYFMAPSDWGGKAYVYLTQQVSEMTLLSNGYLHIDLSKAQQQSWGDDQMVFKILSDSTYPAHYVSSSKWNAYDQYSLDNTTADIHCPGIGNTLYIYENPASVAETVIDSNPPNAKYFFVMIPPDFDEWMSSVPMLSTDGGKTGKPLVAVDGMCGWYSYVFFNEEISDNVLLYRDDDELREDMLGLNGNWETAATPTPIPLGMTFGMGVDSLFFVPDEGQKDNNDGFYYHAIDVDGIEGTCSYTMAAVIYDTDASLHPAFTCYIEKGEWGNSECQKGVTNASLGISVTQAQAIAAAKSCVGVTPGMVQETLGADKKPRLTEAGKNCFISEDLFNMLFNNTPGVNEMTCYDLPFTRATDGKWEFDSDTYTSKGLSVQGGFYPVEATTDADVLAAGSTPVAAARYKHPAQGPVFLAPWWQQLDDTEKMPIYDLLCNGSGWDKGIDCTGKFAGGQDLGGETYRGTTLAEGDNLYVWCWGHYCIGDTPTGWPIFKENTEKTALRTADDAVPRWTSGSVYTGDVSDPDGRNQQFCFESHAQFTHKKGLRFNFRGDDDIWVFIGGRLAVDLGGTHLAAPAYVDLDQLVDANGLPLVAGDEYDMDIFFCDRRTTMSNVRIKTNMYIRQKTNVDAKKRTGTNIYDVCYTKSGDGSCAAALSGSDEAETYCGEELTKNFVVSYTLVAGNSINSPAVPGVENVTTPGVYKCGIDLTDLAAPKVDKDNVCLGAGRYSLFVIIDGKSKKVATFRQSGEVDVVYRDGVAKDTNGVAIKGGTYKLTTSAMGGEFVPVYVSSVGEPENSSDPLEILPDDAVGMQYTISPSSSLMQVYFKNANGEYEKLTSGTSRTIGASGIDTLYVTVDMQDLTQAITPFTIGVTGRPNVMTINFYLPVISFIKEIPADDAAPTKQDGMLPEADGSYEEYWVGSVYDLYLAVFKPDDNGNYYLCSDCNFAIHRDTRTSDYISFSDAEFVNGYATISVIATKEYRYASNTPGSVVAAFNDYVYATFTPIYFREPPVPSPRLADVFDVHGTTPSTEYKISAPYFDMNQEYLDGIGDSVAIYYHRAICKDSLPTKICIVWDSSSAKTYNPYKEGFSNISKDTLIYCNTLVNMALDNIDCSNPVLPTEEGNQCSGYCSRVVNLGGFTLSEKVKTSGKGKVISYAEFKDNGKDIKQGFPGDLTDRIAPIPLSAEVRHIEDADLDSFVVTMSEPVRLVTATYGTNALDFYMNSAVDETESSRYMSALTGTKVNATSAPALGAGANGTGRIRYIYERKDGGVYPQPGDYVRLGGNLSNVFWEDDTTGRNPLGSDTLRNVADAAYYWNSPTAYNETTRLPSPWISVVGETKLEYIPISFAHTGNVIVTDTTPSISVDAIPTLSTKREVAIAEGGRPGFWVKNTSIFQAFSALSDEEQQTVRDELTSDPTSVYFSYEVQYFTNLGTYVAGKSGKIYCDDQQNLNKNKKYFFGGKNCLDDSEDFFIGWNMISDKGRAVGTGAYVTKIQSRVKLGSVKTDKKGDKTSVFGIKRSPLPNLDYMKSSSEE